MSLFVISFTVSFYLVIGGIPLCIVNKLPNNMKKINRELIMVRTVPFPFLSLNTELA